MDVFQGHQADRAERGGVRVLRKGQHTRWVQQCVPVLLALPWTSLAVCHIPFSANGGLILKAFLRTKCRCSSAVFERRFCRTCKLAFWLADMYDVIFPSHRYTLGRVLLPSLFTKQWNVPNVCRRKVYSMVGLICRFVASWQYQWHKRNSNYLFIAWVMGCSAAGRWSWRDERRWHSSPGHGHCITGRWSWRNERRWYPSPGHHCITGGWSWRNERRWHPSPGHGHCVACCRVE